MFRLLAVIFCAALLSGCSSLGGSYGSSGRSPSVSPTQGGFKVGNPYQIQGKWYTPTESYSYDETGISSWYGDEFHGKRTANGEIFNKNDLSAAHPTLQLPSLVRVTNLQTGRSAVLRVNDRGPFSKSRLIDVSHGAAKVLGYDVSGTARVRVQVLDRESRLLAEAARKGYTPQQQMAIAFENPAAQQTDIQVANAPVESSALPAPQNVTKSDIEDLNKQLFRKYPVSPTALFIQVGAFTNPNNASALRAKLAHLGNAQIFQTTVNGQPFNRVRLGPLQDVGAADALLRKVLAAGNPGARIVVD